MGRFIRPWLLCRIMHELRLRYNLTPLGRTEWPAKARQARTAPFIWAAIFCLFTQDAQLALHLRFSQPCIIRSLCCTPAPPLSLYHSPWQVFYLPDMAFSGRLRRLAQQAAPRSPPATRPGPPHRARPGLPRPATAPAGGPSPPQDHAVIPASVTVGTHGHGLFGPVPFGNRGSPG